MTEAEGEEPSRPPDAPDPPPPRQPLVVSFYVLIAIGGEALFVMWLLTPLATWMLDQAGL